MGRALSWMRLMSVLRTGRTCRSNCDGHRQCWKRSMHLVNCLWEGSQSRGPPRTFRSMTGNRSATSSFSQFARLLLPATNNRHVEPSFAGRLTGARLRRDCGRVRMGTWAKRRSPEFRGRHVSLCSGGVPDGGPTGGERCPSVELHEGACHGEAARMAATSPNRGRADCLRRVPITGSFPAVHRSSSPRLPWSEAGKAGDSVRIMPLAGR